MHLLVPTQLAMTLVHLSRLENDQSFPNRKYKDPYSVKFYFCLTQIRLEENASI